MNYIQIKENIINFDNVCQMEISFDGCKFATNPYSIFIFYGNNSGNGLDYDYHVNLTDEEFDSFNHACKNIGIEIDLNRIKKYNV